MPPKAKLHNRNGKIKSFPQKVRNNDPQPSSSPESSIAGSTSENDRKFDVEVCWCIQQLETTLENKNINPKLGEESVKILNVLKSNNQPAVRKRQLMRSHFGDYRAKMLAEEKKAKKVNSNISFSNGASTSGKSTFLRKSAILTSSDNTFRFNFTPAMEEMSISGAPSTPATVTSLNHNSAVNPFNAASNPAIDAINSINAAVNSNNAASNKVLDFSGVSFKFNFGSNNETS